MSRLEEVSEAIVFAHEADRSLKQAYSIEERSLERVAALAAGALARPAVPPPRLASRLAADGLRFCAEERSVRRVESPGFTTPRPRSNQGSLSFLLGAAAACCALWLAGVGPSSPAGPSPAASPDALRAATIAAGTDVRAAWEQGASEVTGDVVWRQQEQDGWLTFRDLPALPEDKAYQLWIVDGTRQGAPVDGGVFRATAAGEETLVTIQPGLPIGRPEAFVVTVEDRAGVVVSKQEHVVAIATL